ncbi:MAG: glycosyltransferase, partial [Flavobacteriaceae bacterium]|nr:glycosyltransferase [Flavobacteriaceae bacterium]
MNVAVVILNWNGKTLLEEFLPSVVENSSGAKIYLADNASNDDSVSFTAEMFPSVEIIRNHSNSGYAGGYNEALKDLSEEIWVLLNNDVEVSPGWLDPILDGFAKDPKLVAAQPKILDYK